MNIKKINPLQSLSIKIVGFLYLTTFINAQAQQVIKEKTTDIDTSYIESKNQLTDYILDTGDRLNIEFANAPEFSGIYRINEEGEIFLNRIKFTYVRGLTIKELTSLLEKRYEEFLLNPEVYIFIDEFKPIRVAVKGEVRSPGVLKFDSFITTNTETIITPSERRRNNISSELNQSTSSNKANIVSLFNSTNYSRNSQAITENSIKRDNDYVTTLSNAIQKAGGLTSLSDISKIEITRYIPIGKGGGKKRALIDFRSYTELADTKNDIRLFDGDTIFIPRLQTKDPSIIPNSILSGLTPKFIEVAIRGQIQNPGNVQIPIEGSLSDLMGLTGPREPLSGSVYLIRYNQDGTLLRKNIRYSSSASPGSNRNPYLLAGDLITVKDSILGRASRTISSITQPFVGIYTAKELYQNITEN